MSQEGDNSFFAKVTFNIHFLVYEMSLVHLFLLKNNLISQVNISILQPLLLIMLFGYKTFNNLLSQITLVSNSKRYKIIQAD